jgi:hypothetical protein
MRTDPLSGALQGCSLHALLMLTAKALTRAGFGDVEILDRRRPSEKSRFGGHELSCRTFLGSLPLHVVVKVVREDVHLRMLDELAGTVLRMRADVGLLVTPHRLSAKKAVIPPTYRPARVEVLDGPALARLVRSAGVGARGRADVDYGFFGELEHASNRLLEFIDKERP